MHGDIYIFLLFYLFYLLIRTVHEGNRDMYTKTHSTGQRTNKCEGI